MPAFTNQASLSYNGVTLSSNIASGNLVEVLTVSKTSLSDTYSPNSNTTFIVSIVNSGASAIGGVTVTDNLGAYSFTPQGGTAQTLYPLTYVPSSVRYFQNGVLQGPPAVTSASPLTVSGITVPAGGNATLIYAVTVNEYAPPTAGSTIVNTATLRSAALTQDVLASDTTNATSSPNLAIYKNVSPTTVTSNGTLTYTFNIENTGAEADADALVTLRDNFDPLLSNISVTLNGAALSPANYTYTAQGQFATLPGVITVPGAEYSQNPATGAWSVVPGMAVVEISGTVTAG